MTYELAASKRQDGSASVTGRFSYTENILFPSSEKLSPDEWSKKAEEFMNEVKKRK